MRHHHLARDVSSSSRGLSVRRAGSALPMTALTLRSAGIVPAAVIAALSRVVAEAAAAPSYTVVDLGLLSRA
jgi:hypothetical protein